MFGIFKRKRPRHPLVEVSYRELYETPGERGYAFVWKLPAQPQIGDRVFVRGINGPAAPAVVINNNASVPQGYTFEDLAEVRRLATPDELTKASAKLARLQAKAQRDETAWLNMARRAAELPTPGRARSAPPEGFNELPQPQPGTTRSVADRHGRTWWRAMHLAQAHGRPSDEVAAFREVAQRWFSIRDNLPG